MAEYDKEKTAQTPSSDDKPFDTSGDILKIVRGYYDDSRHSQKRIERMQRSVTNNSAFRGEFDFSNKVDGQSTESLPKVTTAVESFSAYIRRGLAQFGEWFRVEMTEDDILSPEDISEILKESMRAMPDGVGGVKSIEQVISDGAKVGALDSLVVMKVHGAKRKQSQPEEIKAKPKDRWRLSIDLVPIEDYYPDPTGRKLYEIHQKKVDLFQVVKLADSGIYDKDQVSAIRSSTGSASIDTDSYKVQLDRDESDNTYTSRRNTVSIMECYGTLVDSLGKMVGEGQQVTIANETYVLQGPKAIKAWCGSPLVAGPLTRVPHTVWHRGVMDHVSDLNQALNELYNLVFDAGISAVHSVKEIRLSWLEDPASIAGGISPQQTVAINDTAPAGASAITVAKTGSLPGEVLALLQLVEREILEAAMTNDIKIGSVPQKQVLATEILQSDQATAVLLDAVLGEYEQVLSAALTKAWQIIVQNLPDLDAGGIIRAVGEEKAVLLSRMGAEERYARYVSDARVVVTGISSIQSRSQELKKLIAVLATVRADPLLLQEYGKGIDGKKLFSHIFSSAGIDLSDFSRSDEEIAAIEQQTQGQPGIPPEGPQSGNGLEPQPPPQGAAQLQ